MIEHTYIHIPFCTRKCNYCSFVSGYNIKNKDKYLNALIYEISHVYKKEELKTLYIGGGTPSLLSYKDIKRIIDCFSFQACNEITLEANPESVDKKNFSKLKDCAVNRISLGVQSFNNNILKLIGRKHTEQDILNAVNIIKSAGFNNISIDLIYALPSQTIEILKEDIEKALSLNIKHISIYGLKIEKNSFFGKNPPLNLPDDEEQAKMFLFLSKVIKENNFIHYEISNFAQEGFSSIHNCAYWQNKNYYGFGLNASSFINNIRSKNISDFVQYIKTPLKKQETVILTPQQIMEDEIYLSLRLKEGIDINKINTKFNINFKEKYKTILEKYLNYNLIEYKDEHVKLTEQGILLSNEIMAEFIE